MAGLSLYNLKSKALYNLKSKALLKERKSSAGKGEVKRRRRGFMGRLAVVMIALKDIASEFARHGFALRGGFHPRPSDGVPPLAEGRRTQTLVLAGNVGPTMWRAFASSGVAPGPDPLDRWCAERLAAIARRFDAALLLPQEGPPYWPFQRWARRAEPVHPSPLGILIHPDHGLWHGYRGALLLAERIALPPSDQRPSPCDACAARPCLDACPVGAFTPAGYDVLACAEHIAAAAGAPCLERGCAARRACPIGREHAYEPGQACHHMRAFLAARGTPAD